VTARLLSVNVGLPTPPSTGSGGNQTGGPVRSITYTSYNKPSAITQGARTLAFNHDLSADPYVQAWNRYSYVINNPLAFYNPLPGAPAKS